MHWPDSNSIIDDDSSDSEWGWMGVFVEPSRRQGFD